MATETSPGYSPQLDGLRALAVAGVMYSHWLPAWQFGVPFGAGVHLFFVLSGFLITRILLGLRHSPRWTTVARFYGRRVLRLCPAFYAVLGVAWLTDVPLVRDTWLWHAAYLSNVRIAVDEAWAGHLSHFWSLAVEEQFYLVWPWLMLFSPHRWLGAVVGSAIAAGPVARLTAAACGLSEPYWALVPGGSGDSLGLGALVAWTLWPGRSGAPPPARAVVGTSTAVLAALMWLAMAVLEVQAGTLPPPVAVWRQVLQGVGFAWVVERAVTGFSGPVGRVLGHRWAVAVGRVSYGVYLVHPFAPRVVDAMFGTAPPDAGNVLALGFRACASGVLSLLLATALWHTVELPFRRLKARL